MGEGDMSVLCMDLINLARPNFHSTSDCCCWKQFLASNSKSIVYLNPLISIRHHSNQKIDEHNSSNQHVQSKHKLVKIGKRVRVARSHVHVLVTKDRVERKVSEVLQIHTLPFQREKRRVLWKHELEVSSLGKYSCNLLESTHHLSILCNTSNLVLGCLVRNINHTVIGMNISNTQTWKPTKLNVCQNYILTWSPSLSSSYWCSWD